MDTETSRFFYAAKAILLGLLTTQVISTLHVYLSNVDLFRTVTSITQAGFLAIPNEHVMPSLKNFGSAFFGGCFFTFTIGAGLSVFSFAFAWIWHRIFGRNRILLIPMILLWLGLTVAVNSNGFSLMVASYFLAAPPVVFVSALKWMPKQGKEKVWLNRLIFIAPVVILAVIWAAHADRFSFLNVRDYLLLSNPVGQKINDSYYRYTLYPAQVFKSLEQKTLKTCRLAPMKDKATARRIESLLIKYDYLPVTADGPVDLEIGEATDSLAFKHKGKTVLETTLKEFSSGPRKVLGQFSVETDGHAFFRQATIISLLLGFPLILYVTVFALFDFVLQFFVGSIRSSMVASILCLLVGLALLAPIRMGRLATDSETGLSEALASESWQHRVVALRTVAKQGLEIGSFETYRTLLTSNNIAERYWLTKALGVSDYPQTYEDLLALLDDPHPNVASMAVLALGKRANKETVKEILSRIKTSDHWYVQWYAYRALKRLGWRQSRSE